MNSFSLTTIRYALFTIFTVLGVSISLYLGGCASFDTVFVPEFDRGPNVHTRYYYVESQAEMDMVCRRHADDGRITLGCAAVNPDPKGECWVYLYKNGTADIKEHEDKHCRYGRWHV